MISSTSITTPDGARIAKRLLNHWKHKFEIKQLADCSQILMPDATVSLSATEDQLWVHIDTQREDYLNLEQVLIDHLDRMAQQQFSVQWQHQA